MIFLRWRQSTWTNGWFRFCLKEMMVDWWNQEVTCLNRKKPWMQSNDDDKACCQFTCLSCACIFLFFLYLPLLVPIVSPYYHILATKQSIIDAAGVRMGLGWMGMVDFEHGGRGVMESRGGRWRGLVRRSDAESAGRRHLTAGGFCNATPANREHCAVLCGGSYNGIGRRTRALFCVELWGHWDSFMGSLRRRCRDSRAQCVPDVALCQGRS